MGVWAPSPDPFRASDITLTVGAGGDHSTINSALTALSRLRPVYKKSGITATIRLLSGFTVSEQVLLSGIDLSWVTVTSVDPIVAVNPSAITTALISQDSVTPVFGGIDNAKLPNIGALFAYPDSGNGYAESPKDGVAVANGSRVLFRPGAGVLRPRNGLKVLYDSAATCYMPGLTQGGGGSGAGSVSGVNFSYATGRAVMVSYGSKANLARSQLHHALGDYGIYVIWGSHGDFYQSQVHDTINGNAITCRDGSYANMREAQVARSKRGIHALHNARVNARSSTDPEALAAQWIGDAAQDCGEYGVLASYNSHVDAADLNVSGCGNIGVNASNTSGVCFIGGIADNCTVRGVSAIASDIDAENVSANNCGVGIYADRAAKVNAQGANATGASQFGYVVTGGGYINATGATGTLSQTANTMSGKGIIYVDQ